MQPLRGSLRLPEIAATTLSKVGEALIALDSGAAAVVVSVNGGPYVPIAGVGAVPGGANTAVQFNGAGAFAGDAAQLAYVAPNLVAASAIHADGGMDTSAPAALGVGTVNATTITVGRAGQAVNVPSTLNADGNIDRSAAAPMTIGAVNATTITLGRAGQVVNVTSRLNANGGGVDRSTPGVLQFGTATATSLSFGRAGVPTNALGALTAAESIQQVTAGANAFLGLANGSTAPISAAGSGRIRYNDTTKVFEASVDAGGWATLGGVGTSITLTDNQASAFQFLEGANNYQLFSTVNGAERITWGAGGGIGLPAYTFQLKNNNSTAFLIEHSTVGYITCNTVSPGQLAFGDPTSSVRFLHTLRDNDALALLMQDTGGADYLAFDTTNGAEVITIGNAVTNQDLDFIGVPNFALVDNTASAFGILQGVDEYVVIDTTNLSESIQIGLNAQDPEVRIATETGSIGFFGVAAATRTASYTVTNAVNTRSYDTTTVTTQTLAEVVSQIIADLQTYGLFAV